MDLKALVEQYKNSFQFVKEVLNSTVTEHEKRENKISKMGKEQSKDELHVALGKKIRSN